MFTYGKRSFQQHAARVNGSQGNVPGFPNQFAIFDAPRGRIPNSTPEEVDISLNGPQNIRQTRAERANIGRYEALPLDLPFDYRQEERKKNYLAMLGFGLILVGAYLSLRKSSFWWSSS